MQTRTHTPRPVREGAAKGQKPGPPTELEGTVATPHNNPVPTTPALCAVPKGPHTPLLPQLLPS